MKDIVKDLSRAAYVMFNDGWKSGDLATWAAAEIITLREKLEKAEADDDRVILLEKEFATLRTMYEMKSALIRELVAALARVGGIKGPYSEPWPEQQEGYLSFAVMEARDALAKAKAAGYEP
jgi:phage FluMu protein gp41